MADLVPYPGRDSGNDFDHFPFPFLEVGPCIADLSEGVQKDDKSTRPWGHTAEPPKLISTEINFGWNVYDRLRRKPQAEFFFAFKI